MSNITRAGVVALAALLCAVAATSAQAMTSETDPSLISIRKQKTTNQDQNASTSDASKIAKSKKSKGADSEETRRVPLTSVAPPRGVLTGEVERAERDASPSKERSRDKERKRSEKRRKRKPDVSKRTLLAYAAPAHVNISCFPAELSVILAKVKDRFGERVIVSSGYRSPSHNRRVGGARRSMHMQCKAADIKVPGVNKYVLAKYLKTLKGVGGVGTYGCNAAVHVDVGPKRSWHWRCSRRRRA